MRQWWIKQSLSGHLIGIAQVNMALEDRCDAHNYEPLDVVMDRGGGVWVCDVEGNQYIDFLSAYSALNPGHSYPIPRVLAGQAAQLPLPPWAVRNSQLPLLAKESCELAGPQMLLPMNSGTEAVEIALKATLAWGGEIKRGTTELR